MNKDRFVQLVVFFKIYIIAPDGAFATPNIFLRPKIISKFDNSAYKCDAIWETLHIVKI